MPLKNQKTQQTNPQELDPSNSESFRDDRRALGNETTFVPISYVQVLAGLV